MSDIYVDNSTNLTCTVRDVIVPDMVSFMKHGKKVGSIDGRFDFSNLPPELHSTAMQTLAGQRMCIYMNTDPLTPSEQKELDTHRAKQAPMKSKISTALKSLFSKTY